MNRFLLIILTVFSTYCGYSQKIEFGPMFNLERTTLSVPDGSIYISSSGSVREGGRKTGYEYNFGIGAFMRMPILDNDSYFVVESFYDKTSSKEIEYNFYAINVVPYVSLELFDANINLNFGFGTGYILNKNTFIDESLKQKSFDIFAKAGLSYEYKKRASIELGFYPPITDVVDNYLSRSKVYLGFKIPIKRKNSNK